jgi:predicted DNA-binding ribbon-helix-helix protein
VYSRVAKERVAMSSTLVSRNVTVAGHRTSMRLEPAMWDALGEISRRERQSIHDLCTVVDARRTASSLTAALRIFLVDYFRQAATEDGHLKAGHGLPPARTIEPFPPRRVEPLRTGTG